MKCSNCKTKVDKDKLIVAWIKYFCSSICYSEFKNKQILVTHRQLWRTSSTINKIWKQKKERLAEFWSESSIFIERFNQLKSKWLNRCMITWRFITEDMLSPASFPHILSKWMFKKYRYKLNNIWLVLWIKEHNILDDIIVKLKRDKWLQWLINEIESWKEIRIPYWNTYYNKWLSPNIIIIDELQYT